MDKFKAYAGLAAVVLASQAGAQSITPSSVTRTIDIGETITINKSITLPAAGATKVDVFFLMDTTGSMGGTITSAKNGATAIMNALPNTYRFGVGQYNADPIEFDSAVNEYSQVTSLTSNKATVQAGINSLAVCMFSCGGDTPEANYYGLKRMSEEASWEASSQRVAVWFGDAPSHTETTTKAQAISALSTAGVKVVAFNNTSAGGGIDGRYGAEPVGTRQATDIIAAVGGSLTNNFTGLSNAAFISAVTAQISAAASTLDLLFGHTYGGTGLELVLTCTDVLGCDDVGGSETRTFDLGIKGLVAGTYEFDVFARGVDALEHDIITVRDGGTPPVPEPETYALMLAGLGLVGLMARRRKNGQRV